MKSSKAIREQVVTWLERAQAARDAMRAEVQGMNFPRVSDEVRDDGLRRWAKAEAVVDTLSDVLSFIDGEPYLLSMRDVPARDRWISAPAGLSAKAGPPGTTLGDAMRRG